MNLTNREIDALIATHVFDEPLPLTEPDGIDGTPIGIWTPIDVYGEPSVWDCPKFSTDPAASKQLRDKMRKLGVELELAVASGSVIDLGTDGIQWNSGEVQMNHGAHARSPKNSP